LKLKVGVVHTFLYSVEDIKQMFKKYLPEVEMVNIIDDSLLEEMLKNKALTPRVISRMCDYYTNLEEIGCVCCLNQCSSAGEAADIAAKLVNIPILKIDEAMAAEAVKLGNRIAVVATAISTVEKQAREAGKNVVIEKCFVKGAYDFLLKTGDKQKHNEMVIKKVKEAEKNNDVIVLAQASMYHLMPLLSDIKVPVLTSLETGVAQIRAVLDLDN
jgi:Asp/Glu/hydantoin racemase